MFPNYKDGYIKNPHVFNLNQITNPNVNANNLNGNFHSLRVNKVKQQQNNFFLPQNNITSNQFATNFNPVQ